MRTNRKIPGNKRYAALVDGECEFWYINMIKRIEKSIPININPQIPQKKKLSEQYRNVLRLAEDYDKVFWMVDFDTIASETRDAKGGKTPVQEFEEYCQKLKRDHDNVTIIINNPCLEFWLLLHFEATTRYFDKCEGALNQLKKYVRDYEKTEKFYTQLNNDIFTKLKPNLKTAIQNARRFGKFDSDNPYSGLSQMHLFFDSIGVN